MIADFFDLKQTPVYVVILIQGGKWISQYIWNQGESTEALASRLATSEGTIRDLRRSLEAGNARFSEKMSELSTYLEERRSEFEAMRAHLMELSGEVRARRDYPPDDRRR